MTCAKEIAMAKDPIGSQHAGSTSPSVSQSVPEPSFAERARTLMYLGRTGTLATVSRKHPDWPFGSLMPYGLDVQGRPVFLISTMAMHTQNVRADPRASLLVTQPGWTEDPLAGARVTVMGHVTELPASDLEPIRAAYLTRYEHAAAWVDFDDFAFYRLEVMDVYYVGGFGAMGWVLATDYTKAEPDPLADVAAGIIEHMNQDHADALRLFCRAYANLEAEEAAMTAVDHLGFRMRVRIAERLQGVRLAFTREVRSAQEARTVLVAMVREAREKVGA
jgi:putative heme iron utilization protein